MWVLLWMGPLLVNEFCGMFCVCLFLHAQSFPTLTLCFPFQLHFFIEFHFHYFAAALTIAFCAFSASSSISSKSLHSGGGSSTVHASSHTLSSSSAGNSTVTAPVVHPENPAVFLSAPPSNGGAGGLAIGGSSGNYSTNGSVTAGPTWPQRAWVFRGCSYYFFFCVPLACTAGTVSWFFLVNNNCFVGDWETCW